MAEHQNRPLREQGAAVSKTGVTAVDDTKTDSHREAQIQFAINIETERRRLVSELASRFLTSPSAATAFRHQLRDLRLLSQEVGRLAFGGRQ